MQAYLHTETDRNATTYCVLHQLGTIRKAISSLHQYLARKAQEQRDAERLLTRSGFLRDRLNHRQVALLTHALNHPGETYRVAKHKSVHNVVYQTARTDLIDLEQLGLFDKIKQGNAFVFLAAHDLHERIERLEKATAAPARP